jgi:hypothetical protein
MYAEVGVVMASASAAMMVLETMFGNVCKGALEFVQRVQIVFGRSERQSLGQTEREKEKGAKMKVCPAAITDR